MALHKKGQCQDTKINLQMYRLDNETISMALFSATGKKMHQKITIPHVNHDTSTHLKKNQTVHVEWLPDKTVCPGP